jgi:hypothetical protein
LTASLAHEALVAVRGVAEPQQCESAIYWKALPCVSIRRIGFVDRPTSMRRFGAETDDSQVTLQAVCFEFARHPCMLRRMKLKDSSEPALTGI